MRSSRSDRLYGFFPRGRETAREPEAAAPPPRPRRRDRIRRVLALPLLLLLMLGATWGLVGAVQTGALRAIDQTAAQPTPTATPPLAEAVYEHVAPSVVQVIASGAAASESSVGAGVIIDDAADILTSLHVVDGATSVAVRFADGTESAATVVSTLPAKDIAVIRADAPPARIVPATLGDPGGLAVGVPAFAIGHPFGLTGSLSAGVVSGLGRTLQVPGHEPLTGLIQFDAAVNPGNSGGPLVDDRGEVVGIVTGLVNPAGARVFSGVGFAVTIDDASGALGQPVD